MKKTICLPSQELQEVYDSSISVGPLYKQQDSHSQAWTKMFLDTVIFDLIPHRSSLQPSDWQQPSAGYTTGRQLPKEYRGEKLSQKQSMVAPSWKYHPFAEPRPPILSFGVPDISLMPTVHLISVLKQSSQTQSSWSIQQHHLSYFADSPLSFQNQQFWNDSYIPPMPEPI